MFVEGFCSEYQATAVCAEGMDNVFGSLNSDTLRNTFCSICLHCV